MVRREELKKYLTKSIIMRIDYMPLTDNLVDQINLNVSNKLIDEFEFTRTFEGSINSVDIQVNNAEILENQNFLNINNYTRIKSYEIIRLIDEDIYIKVVINKHFACVEINEEMKYMKYEEYEKIFNILINEIYNNSINIKRIGFRKINDFLIRKTDNTIFDYLNSEFFEYNYDFLKESESEEIIDLIMERKYSIKKDIKEINIITHISQGLLNDEEHVKRAAIDIDVSINDFNILKEIRNNEQIDEKLVEINNTIFKVFINMFTDKFLEELKKTEENTLFIGVNLND